MTVQAILDDGDGDVSDCCHKKAGFQMGKQQGVDPPQIKKTLPDIKNEIYNTDEFGMFSFKVIPCLKTYSHEWIECPFVHPGEVQGTVIWRNITTLVSLLPSFRKEDRATKRCIL